MMRLRVKVANIPPLKISHHWVSAESFLLWQEADFSFLVLIQLKIIKKRKNEFSERIKYIGNCDLKVFRQEPWLSKLKAESSIGSNPGVWQLTSQECKFHPYISFGKVPTYIYCHFKARIFEEKIFCEITAGKIFFFKPQKNAFQQRKVSRTGTKRLILLNVSKFFF